MNKHTFYKMERDTKAIKADAVKAVPQFRINQQKPTNGQLLAKKFETASK